MMLENARGGGAGQVGAPLGGTLGIEAGVATGVVGGGCMRFEFAFSKVPGLCIVCGTTVSGCCVTGMDARSDEVDCGDNDAAGPIGGSVRD
jgi:hypothetical protein